MKKALLILAALAAFGLTAAAHTDMCHTQMYCDGYGCRPIVVCP